MMINRPTTPQSILQILETGIRLWKQSFRQVVSFACVFAIACLGFKLVLHALNNQSQIYGESARTSSSHLGILVGASLLYIIISTVVNVCMIYRINKIASNNSKLDFDTTFSMSFKKLVPFFITGALYGLAVVLGLLFFIIPGIMAASYFIFSSYLVITNEKRIKDAFRESYYLVLGNWWHTFSMLIIFILTFIIPGFLIGTLSNMLYFGEYIAIVVGSMSVIFTYPLFYACILSLLYDLQARKLLKSTQSIQA